MTTPHIQPEAVHTALGSARDLDDLIARLTPDLIQQIGWREWVWTRDVVPQFADDLPILEDDDPNCCGVLSGNATRLLVLYIEPERDWFRILVVER